MRERSDAGNRAACGHVVKGQNSTEKCMGPAVVHRDLSAVPSDRFDVLLPSEKNSLLGPRPADNGKIVHDGAGCGVDNPLFFRIVAKCTKVFTPGTPDFSRVFRYFAS